jgi:hypothetical protein
MPHPKREVRNIFLNGQCRRYQRHRWQISEVVKYTMLSHKQSNQVYVANAEIRYAAFMQFYAMEQF